MSEKLDYKSAGVDIAAGNQAVEKIKKHVKKTFNHSVLTGLGGFGGLYDLSEINQNYQNPVLVQSIDGVGTKMMVAKLMNKYDTIGHDLVSATVNDILVMGAKPYTLLDYIANDKLNPEIIESIVAGMSEACAQNNIALIGGETAEMPNTYLPGEHDLVGVVTGVVEKNKVITGENIQPGNKIYAFASSGLHTNGYSLARKLFFDVANYSVDTYLESLGKTVGESLLTPHVNYTHAVHQLLDNQVEINGMAHITGGGVLENIPRILPENCSAVLNKSQFPQLALFDVLADLSQLPDSELYKTFNMGVGLVLILSPDQEENLKQYSPLDLYLIGKVVEKNNCLETKNTSVVIN